MYTSINIQNVIYYIVGKVENLKFKLLFFNTKKTKIVDIKKRNTIFSVKVYIVYTTTISNL